MTMAGTIPKVIDDKLLNCQLCMKSLTAPKLLPCLHAFCENCLERYIKTFVKEKRHKSAVLDIKVVEDALKGGGLDREIPVHGYDDVVGNYPSLPRMSMGEHQFFKKFNETYKSGFSSSDKLTGHDTLTAKDHEYSEIPLPENDGPVSKNLIANTDQKIPPPHQGNSQVKSDNPSTNNGIYTLEKVTTSPSYIPMNRPPRSKSDPIDQFKFENKPQLSPKSQSARTSTSQDVDSSQISEKNVNNAYIPMGSPSTKAKNNGGSSSGPQSPSSPGITYETMDSSMESVYKESDNNESKKESDNNESKNESNSPKKLSNNLTGFGLASPVSMGLFKKSPKQKDKKDPIYQLEKPIKAERSKHNKRSFKLSKKTSKSVDILSTQGSKNDKHKIIMKDIKDKKSSNSDIQVKDASPTPLSCHMKHSISTPYMPEHSNESSSSVENSQLGDALSQSPVKNPVILQEYFTDSCDNDGYETPINKRKLSCNQSQILQELHIDTETVVKDELPKLPPKKRSNSEQAFSPAVPSRLERGNCLARSRSDETPATKRRQAVGETICISPGGLRTSKITRDSVFDNIYEEVQCDENKVPLDRLSHSKYAAKVPMMTAISPGKMQPVPKQSKQKQGGYIMRSCDDELNPRTQKVQNLLKKKSPNILDNVQTGVDEIPTVGLQLGNKLMRKTQTVLDDDGHNYISDQFEKVQVQHNDEDIELLYAEVREFERVSTSPNYAPEENDSFNNDFMCPICSAAFNLPEDDSVSSLPTCSFLENLKETRRLENNLKPTCKDCNVKADFKCLECDFYMCKKCNDSHNWYKVVHGHQVMTLTQLQSGMYTTQIMSQKQDVCPNHNNEAPQYYCDTCFTAICKECCHCYHTGHKCQLINDVAKRGTAYLENFESMTGHIMHKLRTENLQLDKYRLQYNVAKQKAISEVTRQYVQARELLDDAYQELLRHIDFRYNEEAIYLDQLQKCNDQFLNQVEQTNKMAEHATEYGNQCDVISVAKAIATNLLTLKKIEPMKLEHKMNIKFSPLKSVKPVDILPLLGHTTREYEKITRFVPFESLMQDESRSSKSLVKHLHLFTPKTTSDRKGCKPTGIALTKEDHIVLVDDINKKIKIFKEDGSLVREIVPHDTNELVDPWDVTVTNYGNFAVTDRGSKQVKIFDPDGDLVCHFGPHLTNPWGICCNKDGDLLVTDTDHRCVFVHDSNGNLKYRIDPPSNMAKFPEYVTTNSYSDIIVSDLKAHCIYVFNLLGQFLFKIGPKDLNNPKMKLLHSPCGIYCDQHDNILVADYEMMRVSKFNKNGIFLGHFLTFTDNLRAPQSLIVNKNDHIILSDGNFIKTFSAEPIDVSDLSREELDLELRPKVYNIHKSSKQESETSKSLSDGEGESSELKRQEPLRQTVHVSNRRNNIRQQQNNSFNKRQSRVSMTHKTSNRSSSVPPRNSNYDTQTSIKSIVNYDTPQVSVEKIKQKLNSLDRSVSPPEREKSPVKQAAPVLRNYETAKVSIGKVKEQLINQSKQTGVKPKLRPKPSFKHDGTKLTVDKNSLVTKNKKSVSPNRRSPKLMTKNLSTQSQSNKQVPNKLQTKSKSSPDKNSTRPLPKMSSSTETKQMSSPMKLVTRSTESSIKAANTWVETTKSVIIGETVDSDGWQEEC